MRKPEFITFTGVDAYTDVEGMRALDREYPVEWGVLLSPSSQGKKTRYPNEETLHRIMESGLRLSAHLCGGYSRDLMRGQMPIPPVALLDFERIQVNSKSPVVTYISTLQKLVGARCIAQAQGPEFPEEDRIQWLFDASGGRGVSPDSWPPHPGRLVGYAGGLSPENVEEVLKSINASGRYWIDMESGVRTNDQFDLEKCRRVCELVYEE
jgi:hypothetical protein